MFQVVETAHQLTAATLPHLELEEGVLGRRSKSKATANGPNGRPDHERHMREESLRLRVDGEIWS